MIRHARWVLWVGALFIAGCAAFGLSVSDHVTPYDATNPSSESVRADELVQRTAHFNPNPGITVIVDAPGGTDGAEARDRVSRVVGELRGHRQIARVSSLLDPQGRTLVSKDGKATVVVANFGQVPIKERQNVAQDVLDAFADTPWAAVGGIDTAQAQINKTSADDLLTAETLAFPVLFLLALWFFRGLVAALMPLLVAGVTVVMTYFTLRVFTELTTVSIFALNLVTGLGLGLAIDYSLLFISRYREERARADTHQDALRVTLRTAGRTIVFSALTVAGALASLTVFEENFLLSMGIAGIAVPLLAVFATLVVLPAVLAVLGHRVDALAPARLRRRADSESHAGRSGGWYRLASFVMRRPARIALAGLAALIVLGLPSLGTKFVIADERVLPDTRSSRAVADALREDFGPALSRAVYVVVEDDARAAAPLVARIKELPNTAFVSPPVPLADHTSLITVRPASAPLSDDGKRLVRDIRGLDAPTPFLVGGESARFVDQGSSLADRLPWAVLVVVLATVLFLFLATGSATLPLVSLVMNGLTVAAAFGALVFVFQDGRLEGVLDYDSVGALDTTQPILIMAMVLGLSTDYTVFLLSRIKEAHDSGLGTRDAVAVSVERTGRIITAAALMFCVAMVAFSISEIVFLKEIGLGVAFAVLLDATLVRSTLVPALMELMGKANWWAPRPLRLLHRRIGLDESDGTPLPHPAGRPGATLSAPARADGDTPRDPAVPGD
ncbi:MMPL family transporter [Streptomyces sp. URMC 126]|uniref:MMPL family transporter n=1 Tax=Streptomyces sp. URMC 126 TaxID=3423401 RepID=UPI003F1A0A74